VNRLAGNAAALGLVLLVASSCAQADHVGDVAGGGDSPADAAREHRAQWEAAGVSDYTWRIFVGCFCPVSTSTVQVVAGEPVDLRVDGEPASIKLDQANGFIPLTMEELFDVLDEAYAKHAETVQVTYDPDLGYPTDISIDPNYRCQNPDDMCGVSDDEIQYTVKSFDAN
jgi:hypothetical protein